MRPPLARIVGLTLVMVACDVAPQAPTPGRERAPLRVELDERSVLVGDVAERLDAGDYVYLRLAIVSDSASSSASSSAARMRWVALEGEAPALGERITVRSLAHRSRVWEPTLERDFERLDYVARLR